MFKRTKLTETPTVLSLPHSRCFSLLHSVREIACSLNRVVCARAFLLYHIFPKIATPFLYFLSHGHFFLFVLQVLRLRQKSEALDKAAMPADLLSVDVAPVSKSQNFCLPGRPFFQTHPSASPCSTKASGTCLRDNCL